MTERGNPAAKRHVARQAADIGAIVASCVSVVDPGVVVLGGGLGSSPLLLPDVRETVSRLSYSVEIRALCSARTPRSSVLSNRPSSTPSTAQLVGTPDA